MADANFCLESDQIGAARPQGDGCDIGAIESTTAMPGPTPAPPTICNLPDQIIAANTDRAYKSCPAGNGADTIYMVRDYVLSEPLAPIKTEITIEGNGYTIDGDTRFRIFDVNGGKLTINNATLTKGRAGSSFGGAIRLQNGGSAIANDVRFIDNRASEGGAIGTFFTGNIEVNNSIFVENSGFDRGGAISMNGGGFARITNSSFIRNGSGSGGAIGNFSGGLVVSNSSFIGNRGGRGGALSAGGFPGSVTLTHVTMYDNWSMVGTGVYVNDSRHTRVALSMRNSVIAGGDTKRTEHCVGRLTQNLHNLIEDGSCSPMLSGDPMLAEATDSPAYLDLQAGSPAIRAADARFCHDSDQIGRTRPIAGRCDIGAIQSIPAKQALSECNVITTHGLNLRDEPNGKIVGAVPINETLASLARTQGWFNVEYRGKSGWISADYAVAEGDCG